MQIKIRDATILNPDGNNFKGDIYIDGNIISEIKQKISQEAEYVIDASNKLVIPGIVDMHTHIAMTNMRGLFDDLKFDAFLNRGFMLDSNRTDEEIYWGAKLGILEMLSNGITAFMDLYYSEDIIARAVNEIGIRGFLGWAIVNKEITTQKGDPIKNAENFIRNFRNHELVTPLPAPHGVYSTTRDDLLAAKELSDRFDLPMTMHLSENKKEVYDLVKKEKKRPVEYLEGIGVISDKFIGAHGVYLTLSEIKTLGKYGATIVNNPVSNMKLGNGNFSPILEMLQYGVNVTLGTDSATSSNHLDLIETGRVASYVQKNYREEPTAVPAVEIFKFMTINPYKVLKKKIGLIKEGYLADLAILNKGLNMEPSEGHEIESLIYSGSGRNVQYTIVNGKILYEEGKFKGIDVEEIIKKNVKIYNNYKSLINS
ncbi:MAG: amidohydrolase family protein [Thermoplasmatales archaeon]